MRLLLTGIPLRSATLIVLGVLFFAGVLRAGEPNPPEGFRALFDGKSLDGWHGNNPHQTAKAPAGEREQAIARWSKFADFADQEIVNLKTGLEFEYSAPKSVVQRVIDQLDGLLALPVGDSPFYSPGARSDDEAFDPDRRELAYGSRNVVDDRAHHQGLAPELLADARDVLRAEAGQRQLQAPLAHRHHPGAHCLFTPVDCQRRFRARTP